MNEEIKDYKSYSDEDPEDEDVDEFLRWYDEILKNIKSSKL